MSEIRGQATRIGDIGEDFVYEKLGELLHERETLLDKCKQQMIEGADIFAAISTAVINRGYIRERNGFNTEIITEGQGTDASPELLGTMFEAPNGVLRFGIEVKTINNFISNQYRWGVDKYSILGFDLYEDQRRRDRPGGYIRMLAIREILNNRSGKGYGRYVLSEEEYSKISREIREHRMETEVGRYAFGTVLPGMIIWVLLDGGVQTECETGWRQTQAGKPFACIVFRNVESLFDSLKKLAEEGGLEIDPLRKEDGTTWVRGEGRDHIAMNMWYVPFEKLSDLAEVHMIDEAPDITGANGVGKHYYAENRAYVADAQVQQTRLDYLRQLAGGKVIYYRTEPHAASME